MAYIVIVKELTIKEAGNDFEYYIYPIAALAQSYKLVLIKLAKLRVFQSILQVTTYMTRITEKLLIQNAS